MLVDVVQKRSLAEELDEVEKSVLAVRKNRYQSQQSQKRVVAQVTLWSIVLYVIAAATFLFFYFPPTWKLRLLYSTPLCLAPGLVFVMRRGVLWYFSGKIKSADEELRGLLEKKKSLIEQVKENESYAKAKEILEKYDPEVIKQKNMSQELERLRSQSANNTASGQLRRRVMPDVPGASPQGGRGIRPVAPLTPQHTPGRPPTGSAPGSPMFRPYRPAQPIPPPNRSAFDRMVEFMVGDGPSSRYALICRACLNHNGMALAEEFEFIAFRCAYCGTANPAKKQRPNAPPVPTTPLAVPNPGTLASNRNNSISVISSQRATNPSSSSPITSAKETTLDGEAKSLDDSLDADPSQEPDGEVKNREDHGGAESSLASDEEMDVDETSRTEMAMEELTSSEIEQNLLNKVEDASSSEASVDSTINYANRVLPSTTVESQPISGDHSDNPGSPETAPAPTSDSLPDVVLKASAQPIVEVSDDENS